MASQRSGAWPPSIPIRYRAHGLVYLGYPDTDLIAQRLQEFGEFEAELVTQAMRLVTDSPPGSIIDVGANIGSFALPLAAAMPQHQLICFEAQRLVSYQLCGAAAMNGLSNVHVRHAAVGHLDRREVAIDVPDYGREANIGAMSIDARVNALRGSCTRAGVEAVRAVVLDELSLRDLLLVKIDVEGMELQVLQGAENLLKLNGYPPVLCECWSADWFAEDRQALLAWFSAKGYEVQALGDNLIATHR